MGMTKRFWMLLVCLLLVCGVALAECAICGGDSVCDTCDGNGYQLMQAYGSDEQLKVACTGGCDNGRCPDCAPPCDVCGGDQKCDVCGGLGYLIRQAYGSGEDVKVACTGESCADGACAVCTQVEVEPESAPVPTPAPDQPYVFEDPVVENAARRKLKKEEGEIVTIGELAQITALDLSYSPGGGSKQITSLKDVSRMTHLEELDLSINDVNDLSDLSGLVHLRVLDLAYNDFVDLKPLASLSALEDLDLQGCEGIKDFSLLSTFTNLHTLSLYEIGFKDLTLLQPLTKLKDLNLHGTQVDDLAPLASMTQLEKLDIMHIRTDEWEHLSGLTNLKELELGYTKRSDLSPLASLKQLTRLEIYKADLNDLSPLSRLTNLTDLELYEANITDVSALAPLKKLTRLWLCYNQISDVTPLAGLTELAELNLYGNNVSDASPLDALPALEDLVLTENPAGPKPTQPRHWVTQPSFITSASDEKASPYQIIEDKFLKAISEQAQAQREKENTISFEVWLMMDDTLWQYEVETTEPVLLDALLDENLIGGEYVSWGFNVTRVDDIEAKGNEYWTIEEYNFARGEFESMQDSITTHRVQDGDRYGFRLIR